ncbi:5-bromo-4-chloroindolyl phosphate hydrolysis family protein [Pseudaestuariivita sp.]|uniref:5-bromo-4-chloroindolyl phosphate hydrolysis family protein n=1 Tax=Pseudaestuariivita sp. TaxID=2211669 RepID=UPI004059B2B2
MAQRFGGKYSPGGSTEGDERPRAEAFETARVDPAGARSNVLFVPGVVLLFTTITDGAFTMAAGLLGAAALTLAAWLLRDGLRAEAEYHSRKVARRPAIPRKIFASALTGFGAAFAVVAHAGAAQIIAPFIIGAVATVLHAAAFGIDPLKSKGMEGVDTFQQDRVARAVKEAESHLRGMQDAVKRAGDRQVEARVERFTDKARELLRVVEDDPRDLTAAKKYMGVYLLGARDAAVKFADIYARSRDTQARSDFMMLLTDLEESFGDKTQKLLLDNNTDLTVEIDVLRERLARDGVRR